MRNMANKTRKGGGNYLAKGGYLHETYSAKTLGADGTSIGTIKFFDGQGEALGLDYRSGQNPFESGRGALMALTLDLLGPSGEPFAPSGSTTDIIRHTESQKLINSLVFELKKSTRTQHKGRAGVLMQGADRVYRPSLENPSAPANTVRPFFVVPAHQELMDAKVGKYARVFKTPIIFESNDYVFDFDMLSRTAATVNASLVGHIFRLNALFMELPMTGERPLAAAS